MQKPSTARGTRDFGPQEMVKRNYVFNIIKTHFSRFGFQEIETPSIENLSTLTGKYGDEGDQLLFKILNSGDFIKDINLEDFDKGSKFLLPKISEKGLRYDLTVPFARFVSMNRNDLAFPFRRFQIQPVWRADRPQKGRYREFYQCDADIVGSDSLINESELISLFQSIFRELNLNVHLIINSRKILNGFVESMGATDKFNQFAVSLDKLEKVGLEAVKVELESNGFTVNQINFIENFVNFKGGNEDKISFLKDILKSSSIGQDGIGEVEQILNFAKLNGFANENIIFDFKLARGLSYYTGIIFEGKSTDLTFGSLVGGGRYDNLTESFGLPNMSGVGISFGIERILDVLETLNLFPNLNETSSKILFTYFDAIGQNKCLEYANILRKNNISCEIYPDVTKIKKSFEFADKKKIPFVGIIGAEEIENELITIKNMKNGTQIALSIHEISDYLSEN